MINNMPDWIEYVFLKNGKNRGVEILLTRMNEMVIKKQKTVGQERDENLYIL